MHSTAFNAIVTSYRVEKVSLLVYDNFLNVLLHVYLNVVVLLLMLLTTLLSGCGLCNISLRSVCS